MEAVALEHFVEVDGQEVEDHADVASEHEEIPDEDAVPGAMQIFQFYLVEDLYLGLGLPRVLFPAPHHLHSHVPPHFVVVAVQNIPKRPLPHLLNDLVLIVQVVSAQPVVGSIGFAHITESHLLPLAMLPEVVDILNVHQLQFLVVSELGEELEILG